MSVLFNYIIVLVLLCKIKETCIMYKNDLLGEILKLCIEKIYSLMVFYIFVFEDAIIINWL